MRQTELKLKAPIGKLTRTRDAPGVEAMERRCVSLGKSNLFVPPPW